jgi:hypothetical protein
VLEPGPDEFNGKALRFGFAVGGSARFDSSKAPGASLTVTPTRVGTTQQGRYVYGIEVAAHGYPYTADIAQYTTDSSYARTGEVTWSVLDTQASFPICHIPFTEVVYSGDLIDAPDDILTLSAKDL